MRLEGILTEASTSSATNMEMAIIALWNGDNPPYPKLLEGAQYAVDFLRNQGVKGVGVHMGDGVSKLTDDWKRWGASNGTPKTDFYIGKYRISLKKQGGSQLMSATKGEATATCYAAIEASGMSSSPIVGEMEKYLDKFIKGKNPLNITQQKKTGTAGQDVIDADKMHKDFQKSIRKLFNSDPNFKNAMVFEAMTGDRKFGTSSNGRAGWVLVFDPTGVDMSWDSVDDPAFVNRKSSKTKVSIGWKSVSSTSKKAGKMYSYYSSFRLLEGIQKKIDEEYSKYDGELLTEGIISKITDKIKNWFRNVWNRVSQWLLKSMENVLTFFNLVPDANMSDTKF
jgi:hypothetical protein